MGTNIQSVSKKINFDKSGYFILILIPFVILAFWSTYFSIIFSNIITPSSYAHFHGLMMIVWIALLIVQPILIRKKKLKIHRLLGKVSYFVGPLVLISMLLITHHYRRLITTPAGPTFSNINVWLICYILAIVYRHKISIHARAMIGTAIALLDPIFMRFMFYIVSPILNLSYPVPYFIGVGIVLGVLITLIFLERKQKSGKWVFPLVLGIYVLAYPISFFDIKIPPDSFNKWFNSLPLTPDPKPTNNLVDYRGVYSRGADKISIRDSSYFLITEPTNYFLVWKNNDEFFHDASESTKFERNDKGDVITLKRYFGDKVSETWKKE
jgi:uncharacterized membrane protein